ncbi:Protein SAP1 [Talaromyces islandicus]|uniref:Protein SAP1 n=1 Tax=Talaromyces islandicus TaxID=28573 RepID=A0A0U1LWG2_TALIS|nr:Protein SAP1 [Talaromyces islandicus]
MMRSKPSSSMQKTYDECYLMCSTAVYFEGQNNEAEALRSWRSALETIYYHNAYRVPVNYIPKSETEKALQGSIRQLELQCKERVDLLEALQESRKELEETADNNSNSSGNKDSKQQQQSQQQQSAAPSRSKKPVFLERFEKGKRSTNGGSNSNSNNSGWMGDGTVPPVDYVNLSKPPPLPVRPSAASSKMVMPPPLPPHLERKNSSDAAAAAAALPKPSISPAPASTPLAKESSRGSSPERRKIMLTTLRQKKDSKKPTKSKSPAIRTRPAASKAAGLAWGSTSPALSSDGPSSSTNNPRHSISSDSELRRDSETTRHKARKPLPPDYIPISNWREPQSQDRSHSSTPPLSNVQPVPSDTAAPAAIPKTNPGDPPASKPPVSRQTKPLLPPQYPKYRNEYLSHPRPASRPASSTPISRSASATETPTLGAAENGSNPAKKSMPKSHSTPRKLNDAARTSTSSGSGDEPARTTRRTGANVARGSTDRRKQKAAASRVTPPSSDQEDSAGESSPEKEEDQYFKDIMKKLPRGIDVNAARQILNDIVVRGDEVHWDDIAGLETAKKALKEAVVYPFLRPDLFMGLREPARGMLLFGPPGTGKTMLARAVATESKSTFFSVSASSLTSKWHGESEKLVRALFGLAKALAPSIIFVDEIDSLLSTRSSGSEHEASRRSKTEFLIQWSDLQRAAAGREQDKKEGDASRVLVLAATNLPWDIDEAARRRFVRRQYIPLPENHVRAQQFRRLLGHQTHEMSDEDIEVLVRVTEGFSGSDITALAKDAAMGPLRNLGEALLHTPMDQIRAIRFEDFEASLFTIRPSVGQEGLKRYEDWAREYGERGG